MRQLAILLISFSLISCAAVDKLGESTSSLISSITGGDDNAEPPNELMEYDAELELEILWKESVGDGYDDKHVNLVAAIDGGLIFAAARKGLVLAFNTLDGDEIWKVDTKATLSAGPGIGSNTVIIGTNNAEVLALDKITGEALWSAKVSSEVLSVPVIEQGIVIVRTADGKTIALDETNGHALWEYSQNIPALSIRGSGAPLILNNQVIAGYANGKLIALQLKNGKYDWETSIAIPKGRSEVERLVDIVVSPIEVDGNIYIASYQGGVSVVSAIDGDILWRQEDVSSYSGLSADWGYIYLSDDSSDVWQLEQSSGAAMWKQIDLHQRQLSGTLSYEDYVVVGDFEGYVHWLSNEDGRQLARIRIAKDAIEAQPLIADNIIYIYASDGTLAAVKVKELVREPEE